MDNAIFTIVSNNYFSRALTLIKSIKTTNYGLDFYIVLADDKSNLIEYESSGFNMIYLQDFLNDELLDEMKYKYDLVEFNTSIKPFVFKKLFSKGYKKIIYFDPDIYVYSSLSPLLEILNNYSVALTPHRTCANMAHGEECFNEVELSAAGVFNLGFCAISNTATGNKVVDWWCNKLQDYSYADFKFGLFYDQKWMNFIPCYFPDDVKVLLEPGYNYAPWNFDEREVWDDEGKLYIKDIDGRQSPLYFIHFSGFDPTSSEYIIQKHIIDIHLPKEMLGLCERYAEELLSNRYMEYKDVQYAFNRYTNGDKVTSLHRQLYRALLKNGVRFTNLFSVDKDSFYGILKKSKLLCNESEISKKKDVRDFDDKAKKVNKLLKLSKKILGIKRYTMLMRYMSYVSRFDNQTFLVNLKIPNSKK